MKAISVAVLFLAGCGSPAVDDAPVSDEPTSVAPEAGPRGSGGRTSVEAGAGGAKASGGSTGSGGGSGGAKAAGSGGHTGGAPPVSDAAIELAAPSASVVYLSDLSEKSAVAFDSFGAPARSGTIIGKDVSLAGNPLVINNVVYAKGIECRAFTQIWYTLGGAYTRFVADTGLDYMEDSTRTGFEISLDGALVYDTGNVDKSDVKTIDIDVTGRNEILVYTRTDNYNAPDKDFGVWGGARLLK
jgi:hypothetical protein